MLLYHKLATQQSSTITTALTNTSHPITEVAQKPVFWEECRVKLQIHLKKYFNLV